MKITAISRGKTPLHLVDKRQTPGGIFHEALEERLQKAQDKKQRVLIIGTKSHFASGIICTECGTIPQCKQCSLAIARHQDAHGQLFGLCHLCKTYYPATNVCAHCQGHKFETFGQGLQHLQQELTKRYQFSSAIVDRTQANSFPKITKLHEILDKHDVILATSLLTHPPRNNPFDLVIITHADMGLHAPDLYAPRQNFCFLSEIFDKYSSSEIRCHAYRPDHPSIQYAVNADYDGMRAWMDRSNKQFGYPPYEEICVLIYKHEVEARLYTTVNKLYQELLFLKSSYGQDALSIFATPPVIYKAFGKFRYHIVLKAPELRSFLEIAYSKLKISSRGFKVDWDPKNLM